MKRRPSNRRDRYGVPIDREAWTVEDWRALWRALNRARREIARMHAETPHPMLCFDHGGSQACEVTNRAHGFNCPRCREQNDNQTAVDTLAATR